MSATPGLEISPTAQHAKVIMAASDNPYGLFSFTQDQISTTEEEGVVSAEPYTEKICECIWHIVVKTLTHGYMLFPR